MTLNAIKTEYPQAYARAVYVIAKNIGKLVKPVHAGASVCLHGAQSGFSVGRSAYRGDIYDLVMLLHEADTTIRSVLVKSHGFVNYIQDERVFEDLSGALYKDGHPVFTHQNLPARLTLIHDRLVILLYLHVVTAILKKVFDSDLEELFPFLGNFYNSNRHFLADSFHTLPVYLLSDDYTIEPSARKFYLSALAKLNVLQYSRIAITKVIYRSLLEFFQHEQQKAGSSTEKDDGVLNVLDTSDFDFFRIWELAATHYAITTKGLYSIEYLDTGNSLFGLKNLSPVDQYFGTAYRPDLVICEVPHSSVSAGKFRIIDFKHYSEKNVEGLKNANSVNSVQGLRHDRHYVKMILNDLLGGAPAQNVDKILKHLACTDNSKQSREKFFTDLESMDRYRMLLQRQYTGATVDCEFWVPGVDERVESCFASPGSAYYPDFKVVRVPASEVILELSKLFKI